jgi:hypothetical protein
LLTGLRKNTWAKETPDRSSVARAVITTVCELPDTSTVVGLNEKLSRIGGFVSEVWPRAGNGSRASQTTAEKRESDPRTRVVLNVPLRRG